MPSTPNQQAVAKPVHQEPTPTFSRLLDRAARRQHDVLIIRNHDTDDIRCVRCPSKFTVVSTRAISVSKDRRWQTIGSQIFFECV